MARFKFGKSKKKQPEESDISMTSAEHDHSSVDHSQFHDEPPKASPTLKKTTGFDDHVNTNTIIPKVDITGDAVSPWKRHKLLQSPFPRYRHAASAISSDKNEIFLMGGLKEGSVFGDTWKIYPQNLSGDSFIAKNVEIANNNNPPARVGHSAVLCGNAFIIYGGDTVDTDFNGYPDNNFYLFNINNNKYTIPSHILNKPNGRYGHTIGVISLNSNSSRLYLFGGQLESEVFNDLYYFELNTFKSPKARWELIEPVNNFKPPPVANHSMSVYKNKIYIFGGIYNNEKISNDLWCFDALTNKWSQLPTTGNVPLPVNEHSSCIINDKLYIYGGNDFHGLIYDTLYVLDLHSLVWSQLLSSANSNGPGPRCGHTMSYLPNFNRIIIMGGDKNDYVYSDPDNFDTYENYNGEEYGTMLYGLDLALVDTFLDSQVNANAVGFGSVPGVAGKSPPKKVAASASANPYSKRPESPSPSIQDANRQSLQRHARSFSAGPEDFRTPTGSPTRQLSSNDHDYQEEPSNGVNPIVVGAAAAGTAAAAAIAGSNIILNSTDSSIAPLKISKNINSLESPSNNNDFVDVDVPSSANMSVNEKDHDELNDLDEIKTKNFLSSKEKSSEGSYHNGHASLLDNYNYVDEVRNDNNTTPIITKDSSNFDKPSILNKKELKIDDDEVDDDKTPQAESFSPIQSRSNSQSQPIPSKQRGLLGALNGANRSNDDSKVKKIINELNSELNELKSSTKVQMQNATERIANLERENEALKAENDTFNQGEHVEKINTLNKQLEERDLVIQELKGAIGPENLAINDGEEIPVDAENSRGLTELSKHKLERLELNNKLLYLEQENKSLTEKFDKFEPFMNNQIGQLSDFQKIIKVQEEKIHKLSQQVRDEQVLHKEINDWKVKYDNLSLEFDNFKTIHGDDDIIGDEFEGEEGDVSGLGETGALGSNRSILSTATGRKSKKDISSHLENLVNLWNVKNAAPSIEGGAVDDEVASRSIGSPQENPMIAKLQHQVDDLLRTSKAQQAGSSAEVRALQEDLNQKLQSLKTFEENYRDALQSVNNTSKALNLTQDELKNQRGVIEKLVKENNELKIFKKASRRNSSRLTTPIPEDKFSGSETPIAETEADNEDEDDGITSAHFSMKIKDLEADLYILKQERDQLKESVTSLQKQLYLSQNGQ